MILTIVYVKSFIIKKLRNNVQFLVIQNENYSQALGFSPPPPPPPQVCIEHIQFFFPSFHKMKKSLQKIQIHVSFLRPRHLELPFYQMKSICNNSMAALQ